MRSRGSFTLIGFTAATLLFVGQYGAASEHDELAAEVERGMETWNVPGMAVAVVGQDELRFQQGFGVVDVESGVEVDEHTLFAIASTTKAMVVAGILMLADEGALSLDDKVIKHIPELHFANPALTPEVNIRDMLAHRTGLPRTDFWTFVQNVPFDEQIRRLQLVEQVSPARTRLLYQNTMYELAGLIIERVSGQRWDHFLTERLWQPIGMQETYGARSFADDSLTHVTPYHYVNDKLFVADWDFDDDFADAAGSAWSSIHDMSLWAQFLLRGAVTADGKRLISEKSVADMFEPHQLAAPDDFYPMVELTKPHWRTYGLGWFQQDFQGRMINFHTGSLSGLIAIIGLDRENDEAVVVLGNRDHAEMRHAILWHVMDDDAGADKRDWNKQTWELYEKRRLEQLEKRAEAESGRLDGTSPSLDIDAYAGTYRDAVLGDVVVTRNGKELAFNTDRSDFGMRHWHLDTFQIYDSDLDFRAFAAAEIGPDGEVAALKVFGERFERVNDQAEKD